MKILVITPLFAIAGVPLAQVRFANALQTRGHTVELVIGHVHADHEFTPPKNLKVTIWNKPNVQGMFWPLVQYLRREKPDVVFSAEDHLNIVALMAAIVSRSKAKFSGSCRVTPFDTYSDKLFSKGWLLKQLARFVMKRADALTCVSKDMVAQYQRVFSSPPHQCVYNIVDDTQSRTKMRESCDHPWLQEGRTTPVAVAAGRLATWKGFAGAIEAIHLVNKRRQIRLLILGDGPLRSDLQEMIESLGLANIIELSGYVQNPLKYFTKADIFLLSSLVEGMPNVLVEAMMCGCTPVAADCPTGPRELLQGGRFGYLVPVKDAAAMAEAIEAALDKPISKENLDLAVAPFKEELVLDRHFEILGVPG
ncbi:glycosyltransferase [Pontixanthobacter sp.]|uniref:glycosyltransferase n=1 Tax=Pontixanthobacter sp. TaxID=2792078 RepID=UPI003C7B4ECF